jgi:hypothetical protein
MAVPVRAVPVVVLLVNVIMDVTMIEQSFPTIVAVQRCVQRLEGQRPVR